MLAKDRLSKKIHKTILLLFVFIIPIDLVANEIKVDLLFYNNNLKNSSLLFTQSDGETIEEGIIYIGSKRVRVDYINPKKITIILSEKKSMYLNYELEEAQYFDTNKTFAKIFLELFGGNSFFNNTDIVTQKNNIIIKNNFYIDQDFFEIDVVYEDSPITIRKIRIVENGRAFEIGLYNHKVEEVYEKNIFSLANPFLMN